MTKYMILHPLIGRVFESDDLNCVKEKLKTIHTHYKLRVLRYKEMDISKLK